MYPESRGNFYARGNPALHGRMGVILFGGAQYSLPEQANLTLIFFSPKLLAGGGGHQKFFSGHTQKKFSGHIYKHSTKFFLHSKKNLRNFRN